MSVLLILGTVFTAVCLLVGLLEVVYTVTCRLPHRFHLWRDARADAALPVRSTEVRRVAFAEPLNGASPFARAVKQRTDDSITLRFLSEHDRRAGFRAWEIAYLLAEEGSLGERTVSDLQVQLDDLVGRGLAKIEAIDLRVLPVTPHYRLSESGRSAVPDLIDRGPHEYGRAGADRAI